MLNNYAHIFDILIRLRQAVDHPYLVIYSHAQQNNDYALQAAVTSSSSSSSSSSSNVMMSHGFAIQRPAQVTSAPAPAANKAGLKKGGKGTVDLTQEVECPLCFEPVEDGVRASCGHVFCRLCITDYLSTVAPDTLISPDDAADTGDDFGMAKKRKAPGGEDGHGSGASKGKGKARPEKAKCPQCAKDLTIDLTSSMDADADTGNHTIVEDRENGAFADTGSLWDPSKMRSKSILNKIDLNYFQSSTKMEALMQELSLMVENDPGAKAIVFSQFVNMLDLLEYRIQIGGIGCVKLVGSLNVDQRDVIVKQFQNDVRTKVLLISLKAGGMALNLTAASYIYIMDPWWNPAAEYQAIDRTHRIGQHRPILATRFIVENTIEERILKLQEKKKLVFDGTIGGDAGSMARLTVDDMRFLFG